jgi:hypothetical protein
LQGAGGSPGRLGDALRTLVKTMVSYRNKIQVVVNSRLCYHLYILWWTSMGLGRRLAEHFVQFN